MYTTLLRHNNNRYRIVPLLDHRDKVRCPHIAGKSFAKMWLVKENPNLMSFYVWQHASKDTK